MKEQFKYTVSNIKWDTDGDEDGKRMKLSELASEDIDVWVQAIGNVVDDSYLFGKVIEEATDDEVRNWLDYDRCPAELERAIGEVCEKNGVLFGTDGTLYR